MTKQEPLKSQIYVMSSMWRMRRLMSLKSDITGVAEDQIPRFVGGFQLLESSVDLAAHKVAVFGHLMDFVDDHYCQLPIEYSDCCTVVEKLDTLKAYIGNLPEWQPIRDELAKLPILRFDPNLVICTKPLPYSIAVRSNHRTTNISGSTPAKKPSKRRTIQ